MQAQLDLYQAILNRRSVRRYYKARLDLKMYEHVRALLDEAQPLVPGNRWEPRLRNVDSSEDLAVALGGYGRLVTPPHLLVPALVGEDHVLVDLGYRTEQIAVWLTQLGIGTCFLSVITREAAVRTRFGLLADSHVAAVLLLGRPGETWGDRTFNSLLSSLAGANNKLLAELLFYNGDWSSPSAPPERMAPLIEAARHAPSAYNAQPWRFLWVGERLYLYCHTHLPKYGNGPTTRLVYHDAGTCMANISLAMQAMGQSGQWTLLDAATPGLPSHPPELEPIAKLTLA